MKKYLLLLAVLPTLALAIERDANGRIHRSRAVTSHFKHLHPCPSTGLPKGRCSGWVIDHVEPLACGGRDAVENMQWQTVADGKAKDKIERRMCGK